jgi:hypothetical protein
MDPPPRKAFREGLLLGFRGGDGGVMKGESSWGEDVKCFIGVGGREVLGVLVEEGDNKSPPVLSLLFAFALRLTLKIRLCPDGDCELVSDVFPLRLLPSLSTVFSTAVERRFARLGDEPASFCCSWEVSVNPRVSGEVSTVAAENGTWNGGCNEGNLDIISSAILNREPSGSSARPQLKGCLEGLV